MKVNPQQLMDDGYIILREVIPREQLDQLRASYDALVERQGGQAVVSGRAAATLDDQPCR